MTKSTISHKKRSFIIVLLAGFAFFGHPWGVAATQLIRFATLAPEGSAWMQTMHLLDAEIRRQTNNELGFKFYPNMAMGDERDVLRKIRLGQIQGAGFTGFGLGEILPEIRIMELPYLFRDETEYDSSLAFLGQDFHRGLEERGFVLLSWADVGAIYFLSQKPVAEPADLKGMKSWVWEGDPLAAAFFKELDQPAIPLSVTDVLLSLQTGMIDAVYGSPLAVLALQWFPKLKYISDVPFTNAVGAVLIDKPTFDKLPQEWQQLLLTESGKILRELIIRSRKDNREAYQQLLKEGLKSSPSTAEQRAKLAEVGRGVQVRLAGELYTNELLAKLQDFLAGYRSRHPDRENR
jgi:TRAP-type C4-dicarboxylate transport system substrate-binding protein